MTLRNNTASRAISAARKSAAGEGVGTVPVVPEGSLYPRGFLPMWTEAKDAEQAAYGLAYILQQIQATNSYRPNIGQVNAATSSLEFAIRTLTRESINTIPPEAS